MMGNRQQQVTPRTACGLAGGVSLLAMTIALHASAIAQTAPAAAPKVTEVVVTAERHSEKLKDVPEQVTRITAATLADIDADGEDIRVLAARVPSLNIESSFGRTFPRLYIRGLGNSDYYANSSQPVSVVYDDVLLESPFLKSFPMFDVSDIEVLAGPQGTLFGRNTPAGVVRITSNLPVDKFEASTDDSWGTYNTVNTTDVVNVPVVPGLLDMRFAVQEQHRDNWVHNNYASPAPNQEPTTKTTEGYDDTAGKLEALYKPTPDFDAELTGDFRTVAGSPRLFRANIIQPDSNQLVSGFKAGDAYFDGINFQHINTEGVHLNVRDNVGPATVNFISSYDHGWVASQGDIDGGVDPNNPADTGGYDVETGGPTTVDQITDELRASTNGTGPFFDQGGIYYFHERIYIQNLTFAAPYDTVDENTIENQSDNEKGIYDSATYQLFEPFKIGAGIRYTADQKSYNDNDVDYYNYGYVNAPYNSYDPTQVYKVINTTSGAASSDTSKVTWDTNGDYAVTPTTNLYYRVATGYMPAAMHYDSGDFATPQVARPSTTISYELGVKGSVFDHLADYTLDAYAWDTKNMELTAVGGSSGDTVTILNANKVIGRGLEASVDLRPTGELTFHGTASYNFTEIEQADLTTEGCGGGCIMKNAEDLNPNSKQYGNFYINGNPLPQAPRFILDGTARYEVPITETTSAYFSSDWSWRSGVDFFLYRAVNFDGPALLQGGMRLGYINYAKNYEVAVYARNILNSVVATGAIDFSNLEGFINDPRIVGLEFKKSF